MIDIFLTTLLAGYWSSIGAMVFHTRGTTPLGWRAKEQRLDMEKKQDERTPQGPLKTSLNGYDKTPKVAMLKARLVYPASMK